MAIIRGENAAILTYVNGGWRVTACARSYELDVTTAFLETSTKGTGKSATFVPTKNSFIGTLTGVVNLEPDNQLSLPDLRQKQLAQELLMMRFQREDLLGNVYTDQAYFYISESVDSGNYNDIATFTISLQGTGDLTPIFTPTPFALSAVIRYEYTSTGGESVFGSAALKGKQILEVNVDGKGYSKIVLAPTAPADNQASYDTNTGFITISQALESEVEVYVLYQDIIIESS